MSKPPDQTPSMLRRADLQEKLRQALDIPTTHTMAGQSPAEAEGGHIDLWIDRLLTLGRMLVKDGLAAARPGQQPTTPEQEIAVGILRRVCCMARAEAVVRWGKDTGESSRAAEIYAATHSHLWEELRHLLLIGGVFLDGARDAMRQTVGGLIGADARPAPDNGSVAACPGRTPPPDDEAPPTEGILPGFLSASELAALVEQPVNPVACFLGRLHKQRPDCRVEADSPRTKNEAQFLYRVKDVLPALQEWAQKRRRATGK
jgi:hypothetical protein